MHPPIQLILLTGADDLQYIKLDEQKSLHAGQNLLTQATGGAPTKTVSYSYKQTSSPTGSLCVFVYRKRKSWTTFRNLSVDSQEVKQEEGGV